MISVIIATSCEAVRRGEILRAIDSVLAQQNVACELLLIVNGVKYDPQLLAELQQRTDLRVFYREEGSFPAALRFGRSVASGEFCTFLDDDDVLLNGALAIRLQAIQEDPALDFVATNGFAELHGAGPLRPAELAVWVDSWSENSKGRFVSAERVRAVHADPLKSNFTFNWLGSSAGLFRSATITEEFFDGTTKSYEWTMLTFRLLIAGRKGRFLDVPTFYKQDTLACLSKDPSIDPLLHELRMAETMWSQTPPEKRAMVGPKIRMVLHSLSVFCWQQGSLRQAWAFHWRSLWWPGGWIHLVYTIRLFRRPRLASGQDQSNSPPD